MTLTLLICAYCNDTKSRNLFLISERPFASQLVLSE